MSNCVEIRSKRYANKMIIVAWNIWTNCFTSLIVPKDRSFGDFTIIVGRF